MSIRRLTAPVLGLLLTGSLAVVSTSTASASSASSVPSVKKITDCANDQGVRAAASEGGAYVFACSGTIPLTKTLEIDKPVSFAASGQVVTLTPQFCFSYGCSPSHYMPCPVGSGGVGCGPEGIRIAKVKTKGVVTFSNLTFYGGTVVGSDGAPGTDGTSERGTSPAPPTCPCPGLNGGDAASGGPGTPGTGGSSVSGGALLVEAGTVVLRGDTLTENFAVGGWGAHGGNGGSSVGGAGTPPGPGGTGDGRGGSASTGGNGAAGGHGGGANGGAVVVEPGARVQVIGGTFYDDQAAGSPGGSGGTGGSSVGGLDGNETAPGSSAAGGKGGAGASSGDGHGGAIFNRGTLDLCRVSFKDNGAFAAGYPEQGYDASGEHQIYFGTVPLQPAPQSEEFTQPVAWGATAYLADGANGGEGSPGGQNGPGGIGGDAFGGAVYNAGTLVEKGVTYKGNVAVAGAGGPNGLPAPVPADYAANGLASGHNVYGPASVSRSACAT